MEHDDFFLPIEEARGGCWYCYDRTEPLLFSWEFDTLVHMACIQARLDEVHNDEELRILAQEFGLTPRKQ